MELIFFEDLARSAADRAAGTTAEASDLWVKAYDAALAAIRQATVGRHDQWFYPVDEGEETDKKEEEATQSAWHQAALHAAYRTVGMGACALCGEAI